MAKLATRRAMAYELCCHECGATVYSPEGSTYWTLEEMDFAEPRVRKCLDCEADLKIPNGEPDKVRVILRGTA